jgi:hypothetical protein
MSRGSEVVDAPSCGADAGCPAAGWSLRALLRATSACRHMAATKRTMDASAGVSRARDLRPRRPSRIQHLDSSHHDRRNINSQLEALAPGCKWPRRKRHTSTPPSPTPVTHTASASGTHTHQPAPPSSLLTGREELPVALPGAEAPSRPWVVAAVAAPNTPTNAIATTKLTVSQRSSAQPQ